MAATTDNNNANTKQISSSSSSGKIKKKIKKEKEEDEIKHQKKIEKLRRDLYELWIHWGVTKSVNQTHPPIPPETLLLATKAYGLLRRIYEMGGRKKTSQLLGVENVGRKSWKNVVSNSPALQELVYNQSNPFDPYVSPLSLSLSSNNGNTSSQINLKTKSDGSAILPYGYFDHVENVRKELYDFWIHQGIAVDPKKPPIPPQILLKALGQHRLLRCIKIHGGSKKLSAKLGDLPILPHGKSWKRMVETSPLLQELVRNESNSFHPMLSPKSAYTIDEDGLDFHHKEKKDKKLNRPVGMVEKLEYVRKELYEFWVHQGITDDVIDPQRPPIPPVSFIQALERNDLMHTWEKLGGRKALGEKLGGVDVIDGRNWKRAIKDNPVLQAFVSNSSNIFSEEVTPNIVCTRMYGDKKLLALGRKLRNGKKKPMKYWKKVGNVKWELVSFWESLGVTEHLDPERPPLPSNSFLKAMGRHDLVKGVDRIFGNRTELAKELGVENINGPWRETVKSHKIMREVVEKNPDKFHPEIAPGTKFGFKGDRVFRKKSLYVRPLTKTKYSGFWSEYDKDKIRREIYEFWVHQGMGEYIDPNDPPIPPRNICLVCDRVDFFSNLKSVSYTKKQREELLGLKYIPGRWADAFNSSHVAYLWAQNKTNAAKLSPFAMKKFQLAVQSNVGEKHFKTTEKRRKEIIEIMAAKRIEN